MRIQHNIMAMNAYRNYNINTSAVSKNLEKLSSGYKINRAGDDAAGLAISEKMRAQITGLDAATKNVKDGISLVKTAEGAMQEVQDMLNRMTYLATQSANGTYQDAVDRENLQAEVDQLRSEINRIADSANFNGIKLLDGSLATTASADTVTINGINSYSSAGSKAAFEMKSAFGTITAANTAGATLDFNIGFDDDTSVNVKLTFENDSTGKPTVLRSADGLRTYTVTEGKPTDAQITAAVLGELNANKQLTDEFVVTGASNKIKLEAKEIGTDGRQVRSFELINRKADGTQNDVVNQERGVQLTAGVNAGREIKADDITLYNGGNYDDAVFTINGKKFVVLTGDLDADALSNPVANSDAMHATYGLGSDVTILISDGTNKGLKEADANFEQNIALIAKVTGLTVTDAIAEASATGAGAGEGIRLSKGKGATGGLVLQIGDTADSYNQLRVGIDDMHTKALGIDKITIGNQKDAAAAIDTIKAAINKVSSVRGTLGATQNRLEHTQNNLSVMRENIQDAESTIRDTDIAEEMMAYTKNNILVQSAQAMLAQANQIPQGVLQLLG